MAVLCVVGYVVAHVIAVSTEFIASPVGAAIGSAIMLIPAWLDDAPVVRRAAWRALNIGILSSFVFVGFAFVPQGWWGLLLGIIVWQVAVSVALAPAVERRSISSAADCVADEASYSHCRV
jgi:hypothetical protein